MTTTLDSSDVQEQLDIWKVEEGGIIKMNIDMNVLQGLSRCIEYLKTMPDEEAKRIVNDYRKFCEEYDKLPAHRDEKMEYAKEE